MTRIKVDQRPMRRSYLFVQVREIGPNIHTEKYLFLWHFASTIRKIRKILLIKPENGMQKAISEKRNPVFHILLSAGASCHKRYASVSASLVINKFKFYRHDILSRGNCAVIIGSTLDEF